MGATTDVMEDITVRSASADAVGAVCEAIHAQLAAWVPGTLDVYVRRHPYAPETIALLLDAVEGAASCTGLPGGADLARCELREAAVRAAAAAYEPGRDVRVELAAALAGCRRAAVAFGLLVPLR
ncbi:MULTISPECIES: hypothetical protein [unclassified Streptomyces]|uniref:hypothetical protein n=1 Tax=unclassified Streptomyces TaxID=2593676 RepID=UPI002E37F623|nr:MULTISPECIES: hypothetical protein [unclassified Streptomyces]WUC68969.1 hypothetical protein OG861_32415 [Streptomyces sp. NBC_00539]